MRNSGEFSADWRRYMAYFLVERKDLCLEVIAERGFDTCGVELSDHEFEGNMWWSSAGWIAGLPGVASFHWNMANRYEAEDFLLRHHTSPSPPSPGSTPSLATSGQVASMKRTSKSFCLYHIPHNLYDCPSPRKLYANESYAHRSSPKCYTPPNIACSVNGKGKNCCILRENKI
jgi:hypothetical protein